jgi:hypothetical protein
MTSSSLWNVISKLTCFLFAAYMDDMLHMLLCSSNSVIYEAILRLDGRVKHHFINTVTKELTDYSCKIVKASASKMRSELAGLH